MTNKEIISNLRGLIGKYNLTDEEWQTVEKTIEVLNNSDEDCISREWVLEHQRIVVDDDGIMLPVVDVSIVKKAPSIQPKAKMGHWKRKIVDNGYNADWVCSECGYRVYTDFVSYKYCPMCGARMEKTEQGLAYTDQDTLQSAT